MSFREEILEKMEKDSSLPVFPAVALKIMEMVRDPNVDAGRLAAVIQADPVISAKILKLANSALMSGTEKISSIAQAVTRIGFKELRNSVVAIALMKTFRPTTSIDMGQFWRHSVAVAFATRFMERHAKKISKPLDDSFTAGLLHDLGILILDHYSGEVYKKVSIYAQTEDRELHEAERDVLGIDHAEMGGEILKRWRIPLEIVQAVTYHHDPLAAGQKQIALTQIVHLANFTCSNQGFDNGIGSFPTKFSESAWFDIGLAIEEVPAIISEVNENTHVVESILNIAHS